MIAAVPVPKTSKIWGQEIRGGVARGHGSCLRRKGSKGNLEGFAESCQL